MDRPGTIFITEYTAIPGFRTIFVGTGKSCIDGDLPDGMVEFSQKKVSGAVITPFH
jgi:hypothetical protein